jgi:hypothetical protein
MSEGMGYAHAMPGPLYPAMLERRKCSPSSRLAGATHHFDARDMETCTTYTLLLNVRGMVCKRFIKVRSLQMMVVVG